MPKILGSPHESGSVAPGAQTNRVAPGKQSSAGAATVVHLRFEVSRVGFPAATAGESQNVWNHVDTLRLDPDAIARFARNGLRIGVATPDSQPAIETILNDPRIELHKEQLFARQGRALALPMSRINESESIFVYGLDDRVAGKTFPAGDKLITIDYLLRAGTRGGLELRVGFEIRNDLGVMTWERHNGVVREVPAFDRHVFEGLVAQVALQPGESLVIGLSPETNNEYLVGSRFLSINQNGRRVETLLFISPRSFQSEWPHVRTGS